MTNLENAIIFATHAHHNQIRKVTQGPYILHPLEVASIIETMTDDQDVMAAGVLHDTIEDCGVSPEEIKEKFGDNIYNLVLSETEDKHRERPETETWTERKKESLRELANTDDIRVKQLWMGDKLSNMRSFAREYKKFGDGIFSGLNQKDKKMHEWYYREIARLTSELKDTDAYSEYMTHVEEIFGENK